MDGIAAAASAAKNVQLQQKVGISVMKMAMDQVETQGAEMTKMMESSVQPYLGGNIDLMA